MTTEPPPRARMGQRGAGHLERTEEVGVHDLAPDGQVDIFEALEGVEAEGVVHQHVDAAEVRGGRLHQRAQASGSVMSVGTVRQRVPSSLTSPATSSRVDWRRAANTRSAPGRPEPAPPGGPARAPRPTRCTPCPQAGPSRRPGPPVHPESSSWAQRRTDRPRRAGCHPRRCRTGLRRSTPALNKGESWPFVRTVAAR